VAVVLSPDDRESLEETPEILAHAGATHSWHRPVDRPPGGDARDLGDHARGLAELERGSMAEVTTARVSATAR